MVSRVGDLDDAPNRSLVEVARHPVELSFGARDEPVDGHLHLQLELARRHKNVLVIGLTYTSSERPRNRQIRPLVGLEIP